MSYVDFIIAKRTPRQITLGAVTMGCLASLQTWMVIYPPRHAGLTGSHTLTAFELLKFAALLLTLSWTFVRNRKEDDQPARAKREFVFSMVGSLSVVIDCVILFQRL